ncbi:CYTH domain-containing protein [Arthrobacter sp. PAMC25564]|nr:CYTH domain-containing protein [Arthrobacter sp. PAMC25564]
MTALTLSLAGSDELEVERKYDAAASDPLPPLQSLPGVDHIGPPEQQDLDAVYFDTAELALAARRITLRRRAGGSDAGWHLKLPLAAGNAAKSGSHRAEMTVRCPSGCGSSCASTAGTANSCRSHG